MVGARSTTSVSVVVPAYNSHATIARSLAAIEGQTFRDFEIIVVDSGPSDETERIVTSAFPAVRFIRSETRLFPHAARNRGVEIARGALLVFTDPDIYPHPDWLARLVEAAERDHAEVVVGSIACFGGRALHRGVHLCKFGKWLPQGSRREVDMSPTGNMLIRREQFDRAGGFPGEKFLGDVSLSRSLRANGVPLMFEPSAVVEHHHDATMASFLRERFARGVLFGDIRAEWLTSRLSVLMYLAVTILPIRLLRIASLVAMHAARGGHGSQWIAVYPIAILGHAASLAGEAVAYARALLRGA